MIHPGNDGEYLAPFHNDHPKSSPTALRRTLIPRLYLRWDILVRAASFNELLPFVFQEVGQCRGGFPPA